MSRVVRRNVAALAQLRAADQRRRALPDRIADAVTGFAGSMWFVAVHGVWFGSWLLLNGTGIGRWDPYPFVMLAMIASVEAIFLSTFILISQNRMQRASDRRAELDLQISLLAEHELTRTFTLLERVARHVGVELGDDEEIADIRKDVSPEKVAEQIEQVEG